MERQRRIETNKRILVMVSLRVVVVVAAVVVVVA